MKTLIIILTILAALGLIYYVTIIVHCFIDLFGDFPNPRKLLIPFYAWFKMGKKQRATRKLINANIDSLKYKTSDELKQLLSDIDALNTNNPTLMEFKQQVQEELYSRGDVKKKNRKSNKK